MLPFAHHIQNQSSSGPPGSSVPQQVHGSTNNLSQNLMQMGSQMGFINPQSSIPFNNPNTFMGNFPQLNALQNGHLGIVPNSNISVFPGNGQFGHNLLNMAPQMNHVNGFQNGQFGWQNQVQNLSQFPNLAMLNPSQVAALAQLVGCANQVAQAMNPQNSPFVGHPQQFGVVQPNGVALQTNLGQQVPPQIQSVSYNPQHGQSPPLQGNLGNKQGMHFPNSEQQQNNNFSKNRQKDASNQRFQKSWDKPLHNTKGKHKLSDENGGKGVKSSGPGNSANHSKSGKRRSLSMLYTEKEIQQWREERKKNYPSQANVEKKLANKLRNDAAAAEEAKLRRQQLKDVLAKQVELGFEVPEIPSHYLLDPEDQIQGRDGSKKPLNSGRFQNRYNKRGKFDQNNRFDKRKEASGSFRRREQFVKRKRVEGDDSLKSPLSIKKPTLLQKLLSADIRRDKQRLLQAFRFMVMNSFFKDWPEKPLDFPKVIVKETEFETEVIDKPSSLERKSAGSIEDHETSDKIDGENGGCQEEGEITD